jgi:plastocyanin
MMRAVWTAAAIGLLAAATAGCGSYSGSKSSTSESSGSGGKVDAAGVQANNHGTQVVTGETKVEMDDYYFNPTILKGKGGQQITVELENEGSVEHSFTIDSQRIDKVIPAGKDAKVTVTLPASGSLSFYCKFHKSSGMAGALVTSGGGGAPPTGTNGGADGSSGGGGYGYGK